MLAVAINDSMQRTLSHTGSEKNIILLGAGSEESIGAVRLLQKLLNC